MTLRPRNSNSSGMRWLLTCLALTCTLCGQQVENAKASLKASLRSAIADEKSGDAASALRKLQEIVKGSAPLEITGQARLELLRIYENGGEWWNAVEQLEELRKLKPAEPEYAYQAGVVYRNLSQWAFDRMKTVAPQSARYQQALAEQYSVTGEYGSAEAAFRQAIKADPKLSGSHLGLAMLLLRTGQRDQALAEIDNELAVAPESAVAKQVRQSMGAGLIR